MTKKFTFPRGTADILPQEVFIWQEVESKVRTLLNLYGYKEIRTPVFEETDLFARSVGKTSDIVQKQMLNLLPQGQADANDIKAGGLSLRPEGTASIVRSYIQHGFDRKEKLSKLFYIGPMFRGERPQKGRLRQFHQIGVEALGPESRSPYLDAEVIALSVDLLKSLGLNNFVLKINTLGSIEDKKKFSKVLRDKLKKHLYDLCPDCQNRFDRNVFRVLDCKSKQCRAIIRDLEFDYSYLSQESQQYFGQVKEVLDDLGIKYEEVLNLVRGLDYYTHTVFEISDASLGSQDALGAGGRYNNLVSQLGGPDVDAIGFALGIERILLAMPEKEIKTDTLDVFIISLDESLLKKVFMILNELRKNGVASDMSYKISSMKSQMRLANKTSAKNVVILGEEEDKKGIVTVKNMETGEQSQVEAGVDDISRLLRLIK